MRKVLVLLVLSALVLGVSGVASASSYGPSFPTINRSMSTR